MTTALGEQPRTGALARSYATVAPARTRRICINLSESELDRMRHLARAAGADSLSQYLRRRALDENTGAPGRS